MTRDDIIRMAREAGFDVKAIEGTEEVLERGADSDYYTRHPNIGYMVQTHTVERFAALVAQHERERLAQPEQEPRQWVGLTKEEAKEISLANRPYVVDMVAALEARLKEKNSAN